MVGKSAASITNKETTMIQLDTAIRPFLVDVPEEALVDLRRRIAATRWPPGSECSVFER